LHDALPSCGRISGSAALTDRLQAAPIGRSGAALPQTGALPMRHSLALVLAHAAAPVLAQEAPTPPHQRPGVFVLSGEGVVSATPDMAVLQSGVVTEATTAREALDANTAAMTKLVASFKEAGIEDRDIATSGFTVQPRYVYSKRNDGTQEPPRIAGYEVRNTVTVRVRGLEKLGTVLDSAVTEGSNQIDSL